MRKRRSRCQVCIHIYTFLHIAYIHSHLISGGNTRSVLFYTPFPLSITSASHSTLHSADGASYTDLLGEYTAGLYGHSDPTITSTIISTVQKGLNFGSHHEDEGRLASLVKARFPSMDLLRFTNSGTEANLMALAAAKIATGGRKKVLVFANGYHGGTFLFSGGASSVINVPYEYLIATYNDLDSVYRLLREEGNVGDVAAIIVEPMMGSGGCIPADGAFLMGLRKAADESGAVLIYDEVMTSRMFRGGGMQSQLPVEMRPDMTTLGKYIGGGMSFGSFNVSHTFIWLVLMCCVGAFGGKRSIMEIFDPRRPDSIKHAGTFNNNVLTMAAGRAGLEQVFTPDRAEQLHASGDKLRTRLQEIGRGTLMKVTGVGSLMCFHFVRNPVEQIKCHHDIADSDPTLAGLLHLFLLERDFHIARRGFLALSLALSEADLDGFAKAVQDFVTDYRHLLVESSTDPKL